MNVIIEKYKKMSLPVKSALWYTICNFLNKGLALLTTPIFTRILTEEQYGTFSIFQSWFNILIIFTSLNIFLSSYTKGLIIYKNDVDGFTSSQLSLTFLITVMYGIIYLLNIDFWTSVFDLSPILMFAMFIELLTMPALDFWLAKERFDYKYKKVVIVSLVMNFLSILLSIMFIMNTNNKVEARVFSDLFSKLIFSGSLFVIILFKGKKLFNREYWKYSLSFNIPLLPHYLSNYVLNQSDRIMIGKLVGKVEAAYYSVSYTISTVMLLIITGVNNSLTPYIYKSLSSNNYTSLKKKINPIIFLMFILTMLTMTFAPEIIRIFAGKNYIDAIYVIPPVAASVYFIFIYSLYSTIEYYYQKTGFIAIATTVCALLNLVLNYICINKFGYYAAGYTTLICYILLSLMHYYFYRKIIIKELGIKDLFDVKFIVFLSFILLFVMVIFVFLYKTFITRYIISLIIFIVILLNSKKIINIFIDLKRKA